MKNVAAYKPFHVLFFNPASAIISMVVLAMTLLSGCVSYHSQPISSEKSVATLENRTLADSGLKKFMNSSGRDSVLEWPLKTWDLERLTLAAYYFNPKLDLARAQWAVARGGKKNAAARPNPVLNVAPGRNVTTTTPSPWIPSVLLDFTFETAGKRGHRVAKAESLSEAARLNIASVAWEVRNRVRSSLLELYSARQEEELTREQYALQTSHLKLLNYQYDAGEISAFEVTRARINLESTEISLASSQRRIEDAIVLLASALGMTARSLDKVELSFDGLFQLPEEIPLSELRHQALHRRPDILKALAEYAASEANLRLEIARQYPDINLAPGYEYDQGDNKWSLGLSLPLTLFNRNRGAIEEALAGREESAVRFTMLQAHVIEELDLAIAGYFAAKKQQIDIDKLLSDRQRQENTARAIYEAGEISKSDLLEIQMELNSSAQERLQAQVAACQAFGNLENALQSPAGLTADIRQNPSRQSYLEDEIYKSQKGR